jgi:hypothetical protein
MANNAISGNGLEAGFHQAADRYAPVSAHHVVQEKDAQAAERQAGPENIGEQIRLPEVRGF